MGPNRAAKEYSGYVTNGYRFNSKNKDAKCKTQNNGVFLTTLTTSFASSKDENPTVGNVNYYGAIEEIVEVDYWGEFSVVVFKCCWYQEEKDVYGLTRVNCNKLCQQSDPYVLTSQVQQIFYIEDPVDKMLYNVIKRLPRDWCNVENENANEGQDDTVLHDIHLESQIDEASWCKDDVPKRQVPIQPDEDGRISYHNPPPGRISKKRYAGGKEFLVRGVDPDKFSYTVLLEHVKDDHHYSVIGGIYIQDKLGDWKLVTNDSDMFTLIGEVSSGDHIQFYMDNIVDNKIEPVKQMQPHVIMRPRHNILEGTPSILFSQPHQDENMGENDLEVRCPVIQGTILPPPPPPPAQAHSTSTILPPPPPLTEYGIQRAIRVERNNEVYMALNLPTLSAGLRSSVQKKNSEKEKLQDLSDHDYDLGKDDGSDGDVSVTPLKRTKKEGEKKLLMGRGATTHDGNGSMAAFIAMRKCQREKAEWEKAIVATANASYNRVVEENALQDIEEGGEAVVAPKRLRGKTRMDKVHTRSYDKRIVIQVNEFFQPIEDSNGVLSELSNFLGTLAKLCVFLTYARYIIPDECEKWVEDSIHAAWKGYKCQIKAAHYTTYTNDEDRLQNRPDDIPLERFKMLLEYWNDDSVQARAKKNAVSRKSYLDTHTAGLKSFAQVRNKMAPDSSAPCDVEVYFETRERSDNREYKIDPAIMKSKLDKISKKLSTGDNVSELLTDGKSYGPTWLLGICAKPSQITSSTAPTNTYVQEMTTKIRQSLADEVQEKVRQVQAEVDDQYSAENPVPILGKEELVKKFVKKEAHIPSEDTHRGVEWIKKWNDTDFIPSSNILTEHIAKADELLTNADLKTQLKITALLTKHLQGLHSSTLEKVDTLKEHADKLDLQLKLDKNRYIRPTLEKIEAIEKIQEKQQTQIDEVLANQVSQNAQLEEIQSSVELLLSLLLSDDAKKGEKVVKSKCSPTKILKKKDDKGDDQGNSDKSRGQGKVQGKSSTQNKLSSDDLNAKRLKSSSDKQRMDLETLKEEEARFATDKINLKSKASDAKKPPRPKQKGIVIREMSNSETSKFKTRSQIEIDPKSKGKEKVGEPLKIEKKISSSIPVYQTTMHDDDLIEDETVQILKKRKVIEESKTTSDTAQVVQNEEHQATEETTNSDQVNLEKMAIADKKKLLWKKTTPVEPKSNLLMNQLATFGLRSILADTDVLKKSVRELQHIHYLLEVKSDVTRRWSEYILKAISDLFIISGTKTSQYIPMITEEDEIEIPMLKNFAKLEVILKGKCLCYNENSSNPRVIRLGDGLERTSIKLSELPFIRLVIVKMKK
ncbi:hypothetical protein AgCh_009539 [Apium graveolens]